MHQFRPWRLIVYGNISLWIFHELFFCLKNTPKVTWVSSASPRPLRSYRFLHNPSTSICKLLDGTHRAIFIQCLPQELELIVKSKLFDSTATKSRFDNFILISAQIVVFAKKNDLCVQWKTWISLSIFHSSLRQFLAVVRFTP